LIAMKVVINRGLTDIDVGLLCRRFPAVEFVLLTEGAEGVVQLQNADILITNTSAFTPSVADRLTRYATSLKWVHFTTSERTFSRELALSIRMWPSRKALDSHRQRLGACLRAFVVPARRLREAESARASRQWDRHRMWGSVVTLSGLSATIVGLGSIGQAVARKAKAFGMRVRGVSRSSEVPDGVDDQYPYELLDRALADADVLLLCAASDEVTRHSINGARLRCLKASALLVNVGRGDIIVQSDLVEALASRQLAGAALDVTDPEPLPYESPLWGLPNVMITPHCAGAGTDFWCSCCARVRREPRTISCGRDLTDRIDGQSDRARKNAQPWMGGQVRSL